MSMKRMAKMERLTEKITNKHTGEVLAYRVKFRRDADAAQKLGCLEDLEEQGKLLVLPCAVGDIVYCLYRNDDGKEYIQPMKAYSIDWIVCNRNEFGKLVFTTHEEAEVVLKELSEK